MAGFANKAAIDAAFAAGQVFESSFIKAVFTGKTLNWNSWFKIAGAPAAGSDPATTPGTAYSGTPASPVVGTFSYPDVSPKKKYLAKIEAIGTNNTSIMIYDRLVGVSGLSLASVAGVTVSSTALPRYTTGAGVSAWLEVTTAITGTPPVVTMTYTNESNVGSQVSPSYSLTTANAGAMFRVPLALGDAGVRSVQTLTVGTSSTAGIVNLILLVPIATICLDGAYSGAKQFLFEEPSMPQVQDGANLCLAGFLPAISAATIRGSFTMVYA